MNLKRPSEQPWNPFEPCCCDRLHPVCMLAWGFTNTYNVNCLLMSWSRAGNEFQEKRCLFCTGAHIPYTFGHEEIAPYLHPACARACGCRHRAGRSHGACRNHCTPIPLPPPAWKTRSGTSPGSMRCSCLSWSCTAVAWVEKGIGFHGLCNLRQRSLAWG